MGNYFTNKKVVITGGLGFLGSTLANQLVEADADVTIIDNVDPLYGGNIFNVEKNRNKLQIIEADIRNAEVIAPFIESADLIFHFAAQVSYIDSPSIPLEDLDLNARCTLNILECCRKRNNNVKIFFASSRMIYGKVDDQVISETSPTNPLSLYGIHKLMSEKYLLMYYKDYGIQSTIFRITNPYGPRQQIKHSKYSLVGWFVRQAIEGNEIKVFGDGAQIRDYIYVSDIVDAMMKCAEAPEAAGEVINLGSGTSTRFCDMVETVVKCVNNGKIVYVPWPEDYERIETGDVAFNIDKLKKITSWQPNYSLEHGIMQTYEYYKKYAARYI